MGYFDESSVVLQSKSNKSEQSTEIPIRLLISKLRHEGRLQRIRHVRKGRMELALSSICAKSLSSVICAQRNGVFVTEHREDAKHQRCTSTPN
ncbi:hypothetical protein AVEN_85616-1 [Araneus ventricosus]|uniref:Uncharacterized protein n=1 Tax=Araneus ventricosus TaxID=182803 RepID=A0A4Y2QI90_ARAVE|nr:hypothetical protein AVEN_85616-1 [Araneus ventricosus]